MDRDNATASKAIADAWSLMAGRDWPAAMECWLRIIERFPDNPSGYAGAGAAFREAGQLDKAEEVLGQAVSRFPSSSEVATNYGWVANARRDWDEAVRRWELVRERYPDSPSGYAGGGAALRALGRLDEAEAVLRPAMERLPRSIDIAVTYAGIANMRHDWAEALRRWNDVRSRFPESPSAYVGGATALQQLGRHDEADRLLAEGCERYPRHTELAVAYARLAHEREDWIEAVRRWELVRERFPDSTTARKSVDEARQRLQSTGDGLRSGPVSALQPADITAPAAHIAGAGPAYARRRTQRMFARGSSHH